MFYIKKEITYTKIKRWFRCDRLIPDTPRYYLLEELPAEYNGFGLTELAYERGRINYDKCESIMKIDLPEKVLYNILNSEGDYQTILALLYEKARVYNEFKPILEAGGRQHY